MRNPKESDDLDSKVAKGALAIGIPSCKLAVRGDTGWPDRIFFIFGGNPIIMEFKLPGDDPRPKQNHKIEILQKLGYDVCAVNDYKIAMNKLCSALARAKFIAMQKTANKWLG